MVHVVDHGQTATPGPDRGEMLEELEALLKRAGEHVRELRLAVWARHTIEDRRRPR